MRGLGFAWLLSSAAAGCTGTTRIIGDEERDQASDATDPAAAASNRRASAAPTPALDGLGPEFIELDRAGPTFSFDVAAGTLGFVLDVPQANVVRLLTPDGTPYMRDNVPTGHVRPFTTAPVPVTSDTLRVPAGRWTAELSNTSVVRIAHQRTSDGGFHGGVLDVTVYVPAGLHAEDVRNGIVPGDVVDAARAETHPVIAGKIDAFFTLAKSLLDLDRGVVTFRDTEARFLHLPDEDSVEGAFSVGAGANDNVGVRVLLTEQIRTDGTEGVAGLGAGPFPRGTASTVIVDVTHSDRVEYVRDPAGFVAAAKQIGFTSEGSFAGALLHETSHLWGLSHTSDFGHDDDRDGLVDTPFCTSARLESTDDDCADRRNLMYPVNGFGGYELSSQQLTILHGAAAYRPYDRAVMSTRSWTDPRALDVYFPRPAPGVDARETARWITHRCGVTTSVTRR